MHKVNTTFDFWGEFSFSKGKDLYFFGRGGAR